MHFEGVPSSSTLIEPQAFKLVPSSTALTISLATFCPNLLQNTLMPFATDVASNPWTQASCKITPPKPLLITTGISPPCIGSACSISTASWATCFAKGTTSKSSNISIPWLRPNESKPVSISLPSLATAWQESLVLQR